MRRCVGGEGNRSAGRNSGHIQGRGMASRLCAGSGDCPGTSFKSTARKSCTRDTCLRSCLHVSSLDLLKCHLRFLGRRPRQLHLLKFQCGVSSVTEMTFGWFGRLFSTSRGLFYFCTASLFASFTDSCNRHKFLYSVIIDSNSGHQRSSNLSSNSSFSCSFFSSSETLCRS